MMMIYCLVACWRYVVKQHERGRSLDHHWAIFDDLCHLCDFDYDHVAKVETMSTDAEWLLPTLLQGDASLSVLGKHSADSGRLPYLLLPTLNSGNCLFSLPTVSLCFSVCL